MGRLVCKDSLIYRAAGLLSHRQTFNKPVTVDQLTAANIIMLVSPVVFDGIWLPVQRKLGVVGLIPALYR